MTSKPLALSSTQLDLIRLAIQSVPHEMREQWLHELGRRLRKQDGELSDRYLGRAIRKSLRGVPTLQEQVSASSPNRPNRSYKHD